jgi:hypothetical protein
MLKIPMPQPDLSCERPWKTSAEMSLDVRPCRFCATPLEHVVVDLGMQPLCQSRVTREQLNEPERFYPLRAYVCDRCWLMQVHDHVGGEEIFSHYAYFSSYSASWLEHHRQQVDRIVDRLGLGPDSFVVEVGSNDGYLLQNFVRKGIPCLGIEPAANVAAVAESHGVPCLVKFFGTETARELAEQGRRPQLIVGSNVLAHVPDLNDFVRGFKTLLHPHGVITIESPHLMKQFEENQFDTIYQEHYCYFSLLTLRQVFRKHGLEIFDLDLLDTHGGSLRLYARHAEHADEPVRAIVEQFEQEERSRGLDTLETFKQFAERVAETKRKLLSFLIDAKRRGQRIAAYGAPGKGNTLLNYCGIREDFIDYTVDRNPMKQGTFLVGSRIPVHSPEMIRATRPDYVLILPWNLRDEIMEQLACIREWNGRFVVPIPELQILD